jgi:NAD(P)H-flavin reductase
MIETDATGPVLATMTPRPHAVRRVRRETAETVTIDLDPAPGFAGFAFAAGQFNMLYRFGIGEVAISISGDPTKPERLTHTVRAVGAVSRALSGVKRGDVVGVHGPYGTGWPLAEAEGRDVVVVAGGVGLAPLRPALYQLLAHRGRYGRVLLLYGARTPADLLYRRELAAWGRRAEVGVTVDRAAGGWQGNVGVVTQLLAKEQLAPSTVAMMCGPEVMMRFTIRELQRQGVPEEGIYVSLERNMKCAVGLCGHCQFGPTFVCKDGPVFRYDRVRPFLTIREY